MEDEQLEAVSGATCEKIKDQITRSVVDEPSKQLEEFHPFVILSLKL